MESFLNLFVGYMDNGGFVMWPLFIANLFLWYGLGYRFLTLSRGRKKSTRTLVEAHMKKGSYKGVKGIIDEVIKDSIAVYNQTKHSPYVRDYIQDVQFKHYQEIKKYALLVKIIIVIAPLTGLLGTVVGMIETFDSLQSAALFTQGGGIAGGISQALFTTQLGLVVAVPGLILGRILEKQQHGLELEFEQVKDILSSKEG